jgi:hypothetical protein
VQAILAAIAHLADHPCLHARGDHPSTREFTCERHRIVYEVNPDIGSNTTAGDVVVLRIFGPGQDRSQMS